MVLFHMSQQVDNRERSCLDPRFVENCKGIGWDALSWAPVPRSPTFSDHPGLGTLLGRPRVLLLSRTLGIVPS